MDLTKENIIALFFVALDIFKKGFYRGFIFLKYFKSCQKIFLIFYVATHFLVSAIYEK
jgi:hypothetical protein